ncbi:MAG: HI0074 family nucleotidyltransferase substrate-binding subunit [Candidatus Omnitrophota bacterium]
MTKLESLIKDLTSAKNRLKEASSLPSSPINRDATIQRFEFCFELAWKTIQAYVRDQGLDCKSPKNCLRIAADLGLVTNLEDWFAYLEARNLIAHTYNEELANKVYQQAVKFPLEVGNLLKNVKD